MPTPRSGESEDDFVSRCIPIVIDEGTAEDGSQAAAICHSMYRESKKEEMRPMTNKEITGSPEQDLHGPHSTRTELDDLEPTKETKDSWLRGEQDLDEILPIK